MTTESTRSELARTGINVIGNVRWGTHFCSFYETKDDLLETLVLYFKTGLESKEFCVWVVSHAVKVEEAKHALGRAVPDLQRHLAEGNLEIHCHDKWYLYDGQWDPNRVLRSWREKLTQTSEKGYAGLRASGDAGWVQNGDWMAFREYEEQVSAMIADQRTIILCTYPLATSPGNQVFDAAHIHEVAVARRHGSWEAIEAPELKEAKAEIKRLNQELEQKVEERTRELAAANETLRQRILERKEQALRYKTLMETSTDSIYVLNEKGDLQEANAAFLRRRGYNAGEVNALNVAEWDAQWSREQLQQRLGMRAGHSAVFETRHRCKDGSIFDVEVCGTSVLIGGEKLLFCVARDITERKRAEERLREYEKVVEGLEEMIVVVDRDYRYLLANRAFLNYRGLEREQLLGRFVTDILDKGSLENVIRPKLAECLKGKALKYEMRYTFPNHGERDLLISYFPIESSAGIDRVACVLQDITERKQAEDRLRRSEEKFKTLFGIAPVGISVLDRQHNVVDANPALEQITRLRKEDLLNGTSRPRTILNADGTIQPPHEFPSERAMALNQAVNDVQMGIVTEDGEIIWVQVSAAPLDLPDASAVVITQDITERKRAAEELEDANRQLRILSRQLFHIQEEERRHLARELHDEIGQTLTAAKINLKIIAPDVPTEVAGRLDDSVRLLDRLLRQVRELSLDLRPPLLDELGLVPTLRWLVDQQAQRAGLRVTFTANVDGLEINPDTQTACFRVAQEAITNIVRHAGAKHVAVEVWCEAEHLTLRVCDDGAGFESAGIQQRTTQDFTLGLVSMKERALLVRGGFEVQSTPGKGTEVRAWFPMAPGGQLSTEKA
jgi:PAS domain S-box-containing protein